MPQNEEQKPYWKCPGCGEKITCLNYYEDVTISGTCDLILPDLKEETIKNWGKATEANKRSIINDQFMTENHDQEDQSDGDNYHLECTECGQEIERSNIVLVIPEQTQKKKNPKLTEEEQAEALSEVVPRNHKFIEDNNPRVSNIYGSVINSMIACPKCKQFNILNEGPLGKDTDEIITCTMCRSDLKITYDIGFASCKVTAKLLTKPNNNA